MVQGLVPRQQDGNAVQKEHQKLAGYLPGGTDLSGISQSYPNAIALRFNQRPRKVLGFKMPSDRLQAALPRPVERTDC